MFDLDDARTAEYLLRATPTQVFDWMQSQPRRKPTAGFLSGSSVPEAIELALLSRNDELIDLSLASWGSHDDVLKQVYLRGCSRSAVNAWPPEAGSYGYTCLASLLSNHWIRMSPWKVGDFGSVRALPSDDIEWLIQFGDIECLRALHKSYGMAVGLLFSCSSKFGPYGRMDEDRWLRCIALLGSNEALHVEEESNDSGPDTLHWDIHKAFVDAAIVCPKTPSGAIVLGRLFQDLPTKASADTQVDRDSLAKAVELWNVPIVADDKDMDFVYLFGPEYDGLGLGERIQFHLLRHYARSWEVDPDDDSRIKRLCAYAISPETGGKPVLPASYSERGCGKGLNIEQLGEYADKDGRAFIYASSFNESIWGFPQFSEMLIKSEREFSAPSNLFHVLANRKDAASRSARKKKQLSLEDDEQLETTLEDQSTSIDGVAELRNRVLNLEKQIRSARSTVVWVGFAVTLVLLIFR